MKIGIISPIGFDNFIEYFNSEDDKLLVEKETPTNAPSVTTLVLSLLKDGHFVRIFTLGSIGISVKSPRLEIYTIKRYQKYPFKYLWGAYSNGHNMSILMRNHIEDLDILHAHWSYEYAYAAKQFKDIKPVFCTVRDWAPLIFRMESLKNKPYWVFKMIMAYQLYHTKGIHFIANSPYTAKLLVDNCNIKAPMLPNSVKDTFFSEVSHRTPDKLRILCISSSDDKRKNIISLLRAFQIVRKQYSDATLELVGAPFCEQGKSFSFWSRAGLLDGNVFLRGKVKHDELTNYIDQATMFVTPSLEETFGNTLLEAMSRYVPVIGGKNSGAVPFVLHNGEAGFLCNVSSPKEIAEKICYVYNHPKEAATVAEKAYGIIKNEYSESIVCKHHVKLYNDVLLLR